MKSDRDHALRIARQIGAVLKRVRTERRMRQYVVAEFAGITKSMLSAYERGKQCPHLTTLMKVLRVLDCSAEEFGKHLGPWDGVHAASAASLERAGR